jgi:hypothetical protein
MFVLGAAEFFSIVRVFGGTALQAWRFGPHQFMSKVPKEEDGILI